MKRALFLALLVAPIMVGCGNADTVPGHTAAEDAALNAEKNMTPEQRIEQIKNSPMPQGAKDAMIAKIKGENGIK